MSNPTGHSVHPAYRPDIDGLRAVAVTSVVLYHAFPRILPGGFIGVDIFFVISGFLISTILFNSLEQNRFSFLDFYARRARRIFPGLVLVLLVCLLFGWFMLLTDEYERLGKHVAAGAAFLSNFVLWGDSGYFDVSASQKPLLHLWSLGIEEQFYLLWPLLLWLAYRRGKQRFLAITLGIAAVSFVVNILTVKAHPEAAFYSPASRFWELMIGGLLAYLKIHRPGFLQQGASLQSCGGFALLLAGLLLIREDAAFPGWWALLPTLGAFLLISAGPAGLFNRFLLSNRLAVGIGLISYPLYLWHWPALFFNTLLSNPPTRLARLTAVGVAIVLAVLTYFLVERPVRKAKFAAALYLTSALAVCGAVGLAGSLEGGFPSRLPQQLTRFAFSADADRQTECIRLNRFDFPAKCTQTDRHPGVFIWGDSHADRLYAGLLPLQEKGSLGIYEVAGSACAPLLNNPSRQNSACEQIRSYALASIQRLKPEIVLMHAYWSDERYDLSMLAVTIRQLREYGVPRIVILGPVPRWDGTLLRSIFRCWHPRTATEDLPLYSSCGLDGRVPEVDAQLRQEASRLGVEYISAYQALCNPEGCLTHVTADVEQLTTYDYGHLSVGASQYLIQSIGPELLSGAAARVGAIETRK
jgi:peptidoglycan/LPS O-acetylase OafA/YrhL